MSQQSMRTVDWSDSQIYTHATPYWEMATGKGTSSATTTFEHEHDKDDFQYPDPNKRSRYVGARAKALGYLKVGFRLLRFLQSPLGYKLVEVDCSKPGLSREREHRIRRIADEFVALCSRYTKMNQYQRGDLQAVAQERGIAPTSISLRWGFGFAIVSKDFVAMKRRWLAEEKEETAAMEQPVAELAPVLPATPLAVVVGVQLPAAPAPAPERPPRSPSVVDMDEDAKLELVDLANTICENGYEAHMRRVQELVGAPRLGEIMRALENTLDQPETIPTVVPDPAPAPAPAPAPVEHVNGTLKPKPKKPMAAPSQKRAAPAVIKPAPGPRKKQAPSPAAEPETTLVGVDMQTLGTEILNAFGEAKKAHKTNVYESIFTIMNAEKPLYAIVTKRRKDGASAGGQDTEVHVKPPLSKTIGKTRLRSNPNIKAAFRLA